MKITQTALKNPAGVAVGVAIVTLFGLFSILQLPIQLFPDIEEPVVSINTSWRAASPREIESEILEPQEEVLQGINGLVAISANANQGNAWINMRFSLETDMQQTLMEIISRLNRLPPLPRDANPPVINFGGGDANENLTWFFIQKLPENPNPAQFYARQLDDILKPAIESIPGVAGVRLHNIVPEELQIVFDPYRAAQLGIQIPQVAAIAGSANDVSGGFVDVGRRKYTLRFAGRYTPEQLNDLILEWRDGRPVKLGDIAEIGIARSPNGNFAYQNGNPAISMQVLRENGANVLDTLNAVKEKVDELRDGPISELGLDIQQSFDASVFIYRAIGLVTNNLALGVMLAIGILWWFMRQARATLIVAMAIPVSILTTLVVLNLAGRSLNVISLAGLAFAVGMVMDAAIVVLENIIRIKSGGTPADKAAEKGTSQVLGALVASTATTVAIFLPVIFLKDVEGQLFADLALTIAIAVTVSLVIAITLLPTAATRWLKDTDLQDKNAHIWERMTSGIMRLTGTARRRAVMIVGLMTVPIAITFLALPHLDYLPPVKRDAVDGFFSFPPGANTETIENEIVSVMVDRLQPYMDGEKEPSLKNYYIWVWPNGGTIGARANDQNKVKELERVIREEVVAGLPDTQAFIAQGNLFGGGGNRQIALHIQSRDSDALLVAARLGMELIPQKIPGTQPRPEPGTEMAEPELRVIPNDQRINEAGWNRATAANLVRALGDGVWIGEHFDGEKRMDIILRAKDWDNPEQLEQVPLATPNGGVMPLGELMNIQRTVGPSQLRRINRRRTVTLSFEPPENMSLEEAIQILEDEVEPELKRVLPADGAVLYGGSASSLKIAIRNMSQNFILALIILFMLMSALFRSVKDSLMVTLSLPLATVGGVVALRILNLVTFQPLDLLTMIGFIILMGLVVNNAILLVHQTRSTEREGVSRREAVQIALRLRLRPIFMSTMTSLFGMLPLVLLPGAGSVIYRGLAVVIVGGMSVSTIFTLLLLPSLLRLGESRRESELMIKGIAS